MSSSDVSGGGDPATEDQRRRSRAAVGALLQALTAGHAADAVSACTGDAVWWLPSGADHDVPVREAVGQLLALVGPERSAEEPLIITSDDGELAVVEQVVQAPLTAAATTVTSVLQLRDGVVFAGRTYADVAAWPAPQQASLARSEMP